LTRPANPVAARLLAAARDHAQAGRLEGALEAARQATRMDPTLGEAFAIWGVTAAELGRFGDAVEPLMVAAGRLPAGSVGWANITSQLGRSLSNTGFWAEALQRIEAVERLNPPDPVIRHRIGAAFARMNLPERGLPHLEWARGQGAAWPELLTELGLAHMSEGRLDAAEEAFEAAIEQAPLLVQPHSGIAQLRRWTPETAHVARLAAARADAGVSPLDRATLGFALFKELDDLGRTDEAWKVLEESNEACWSESTSDWSLAHAGELVRALAEVFPADRLRNVTPLRESGATPIFIVGLPRSGTTLLERMIAAHSEVHALGESPSFPIAFRSVSTESDRRTLTPQVVRSTAAGDWRAVGELYLQETRPFAGDARYFIDKLPANSLLVGAIRLALPQAVIISMRRRPMDALFGAYKVRFGHWYGWSYRQQDLATHYIEHEKLTAHWREGLGDGLVEVDYEQLVADPEPQIRRVLAACGLAFEPACLRPQDTQGAVRTASMAQVREPITTARIGGWRRYERQLEPLRAALQAAGLDAG
jgi:tetratricopeptide (TPR) repeat protein